MVKHLLRRDGGIRRAVDPELSDFKNFMLNQIIAGEAGEAGGKKD
jgi:hypothetical protein